MPWAVVAHAFNPNTWEVEMGRSLWVQGQCGLEWVLGQPKLHRETLSQIERKKKRKKERKKERRIKFLCTVTSNIESAFLMCRVLYIQINVYLQYRLEMPKEIDWAWTEHVQPFLSHYTAEELLHGIYGLRSHLQYTVGCGQVMNKSCTS